jgi:ABC-type multidrug transport system fused ATPase/permease subunit
LIEIKNYLNIKQKLYLVLLSFLWLLVSILETIGLGTIPVVIGSIYSEESFYNKLSFFASENFFNKFTQREILFYLLIFVLLFFFFKNAFQGLVFFIQGKIMKNIKISIQTKIFNFYLNQDYLYFIKKNSSVLIRTLTLDVAHTIAYILCALNLLRDTLILLAIFFLLLISSVKLTLFLITTFLLFVFFFNFFSKKNFFLRGKSIQYLSKEIIKLISETSAIFKELKIYNLEVYQRNLYLKKILSNENYIFKNHFINSLPRLFLEILAIFLIISIILFFLLKGTSTVDILSIITLFVISTLRIIPTIGSISTSINVLKSNQASYFHVLDELLAEKNYFKKYKENNFFIFDKEINIQNVYFNYPENKKNVINNLNLKIIKGDRLGIIGESGSGKTTLINLIIGLIKPAKGYIYVDGKLFSSDNNSLIKNVGYVPQEINLIEDTIISNIALGSDKKKISLPKIYDVCKLTKIYDFISSLDKGFETMVKEKGNNFSVGQKQRIGVSRALYQSNEVLILDESTSSLDENTEKEFIDDIFSINNKSLTIIFISHKKSALIKCNKIFDVKENKFI